MDVYDSKLMLHFHFEIFTRLLSYGKRQFLNCAKFNVAFVINMLLKRKKFWGFFVVFLQKIKTHSQILGKKLATVTSETLKIKTQ